MSFKKLYTIFFLVGWFFFPFNDFEGIPALGEFKNEAGSFFFMGGFLILLIDVVYYKKISIPYNNRLFQLLLLFLLWCALTVVFNYSTVSVNYYKHTGGFYRFIRQYISLIISCLFFLLLYWNVVNQWDASKILLKIRKVLFISLTVVFVYGFLETMIVVFQISIVKPIFEIFNYFPFVSAKYYSPGGRISSVAYETPSLGNYLITISGWMFSYLLTEKSKFKFIPTLMILFLTFFSGSRTALINVTIQLLILLFVLYSLPQYRKNVIQIFKYSFLIVIILLIFNGDKIVKSTEKKIDSLNFSKNLKNNISNQSRFGMQYASLQVFKENPIIGVGFGQETYHKRYHYPKWATRNNWEFKYVYQNNSIKSFPTAYNIYTRLLAEIGLIGFFIFLGLIFFSIQKSFFLFKNSQNENKVLAFITMISFVGLSLNWMQTDFFRQHGFWLCLVILIKISYTEDYLKKRN